MCRKDRESVNLFILIMVRIRLTSLPIPEVGADFNSAEEVEIPDIPRLFAIGTKAPVLSKSNAVFGSERNAGAFERREEPVVELERSSKSRDRTVDESLKGLMDFSASLSGGTGLVWDFLSVFVIILRPTLVEGFPFCERPWHQDSPLANASTRPTKSVNGTEKDR